MTSKSEILKKISVGENSEIEFKREINDPHDLAKEMVGFLNSEGGFIIVGVDNDGTVTDINKKRTEEVVVSACRDKIDPPIRLICDIHPDVQDGKSIAVIKVPRGEKVHAVLHDSKRKYNARICSFNSDLRPGELAKLFQSRWETRAELKIVSGTSVEDLDKRRIDQYFDVIRKRNLPATPERMKLLLSDINNGRRKQRDYIFARLLLLLGDFFNIRRKLIETSDGEDLINMLINSEIMNDEGVTMAGILLFGSEPTNHLTNAGIVVAVYSGTDKDSKTVNRKEFKGPMTPLLGDDQVSIIDGLVESSVDYVQRNIPTANRDGSEAPQNSYPSDVLREAIVNALVHRDYLCSGTDIEISIYRDRLEIISPGQLPGEVTVNNIASGMRITRNQLLNLIMREYGYFGGLGRGVPHTIVRGMQEHNNTEPIFEENNHRFRLTLHAKPPS